MKDHPEFASIDALTTFLHKRDGEQVQGITHPEFVAGVNRRALGFRCIACEPHQLLRGEGWLIFNTLVVLYLVAPAVLVSAWAWREHNAWLLAGVVLSAAGSWIAARLIYLEGLQQSIAALLLPATVVMWLLLGAYSYITFFILCGSWGFWLFMLADLAERTFAMRSLVKHPKVFEDAIARGAIVIVRARADSTVR